VAFHRRNGYSFPKKMVGDITFS